MTAQPTACDLDPTLTPLDHLRGARDATRPEDRARALRAQARALRGDLLARAPARYFRSFPLVRVPYPTRFGLLNACAVPTPMMHLVNRVFIVQFDAPDGLKTLLVSPSDVMANAETPFFKRLSAAFGPFQTLGQRLAAPILGSVEAALATAGIRPEQVDYITYDHLHTQDLRRWLGDSTTRGYLPNAKLLVTRREWEATHALAPPQRDWYCPHGIDGVRADRVVLLDGDTLLGDSVALIHTPGHTEGNHSIVVHTPEGLMVTSENGVGPDAYAPDRSAIPGLKRYARDRDMEVVLNGNTLERGLDQYLSMLVEKTLAGPSLRHPDFPNVVSSSEFAAYWAFPGLKPTFSFGDLCFGTPQRAA